MKSNKSSEFSGFSITYQLAMMLITELFSSQKFKTILKSDTCSVDNEHEIRLTRMKQSERSYQSSSWTTWSHGCTLEQRCHGDDDYNNNNADDNYNDNNDDYCSKVHKMHTGKDLVNDANLFQDEKGHDDYDFNNEMRC